MSVYDIAIKRRTIRRFKNIAVPRQVLEKCVNAARLVPSAANLQPLEYIIVNEEALLAQIFATLRWAAYISPAGNPPEGNEPKAYIVILSNKNTARTVSAFDTGAAMQNIILVALEEGIGACALAAVDRDKLRSLLNIPADYEIPLVIALGYPDEQPVEEPFSGSVKYWKDDAGVLHVPKKSLQSITHWNGLPGR